MKHGEEVLKKAMKNVNMGRTIVFPVTQAHERRGLWILLVGVRGGEGENADNPRLTFGGQMTVWEKRGAREYCLSWKVGR